MKANEVRAEVAKALAAAGSVRLLLVWTIGLFLPTLAVWLPVWQQLAGLYDFSPRAVTIARHFDMLAFEDTLVALKPATPALVGATLFAAFLSFLLAPFLAAVTATAIRQRAAGFKSLLQGGLGEYGRMFRMALVALVPLGATGAVAAATFGLARRHAEAAVLETSAVSAHQLALLVTLLTFMWMHATVEAGRAYLIVGEPTATRAWLRGMKLTLKRPLALLTLYLGPTLVASLAAGLFLVVRLRLTPRNFGLFWLAFLLTQLAVAAIGWGRAARLFALTALVERERQAAPRAPAATPAADADETGAEPEPPHDGES